MAKTLVRSEPNFSFTDINDLALDVEWKRHCDAVEKYAKKLAKAQKRHADAKAALKVTEAEVELEIRSSTGKKLTEAGVKASVILHERTREAVKLVNDTKYAVDMYQAAIDTLDHRKKSLSDRVSLWMADYFKEPSVKGPARKRLEEENKEVRRRRSD